MHWMTLYKAEIKQGKVIVGNKILTVLDIIEERAKRYSFSQAEADFAIAFIEQFCSHYKGKFAGKRLELSLWQKVILEAIFGLQNDGRRLIRESFIVVARKCGKSTLASGISLFGLVADGEEGAECYSVANKLDQAKIIYKSCFNMVQNSPQLSRKIRKTRASLEYGSSELMPLASDSKTLDGLNPHIAIFDEGHGASGTTGMALYDVIDSAFGAREQPLFLHITTAGTVREGVFDYLYSRSEKVLNGMSDEDTFLPFIFELDSELEYTNEAMWEKANPNIDISVDREYLRAKVEKAKTDPTARAGILTKHFNVRQTSSNLWLTFETLNNESTFTDQDFSDCYAIGGCDLSSTTDLSCATLLTIKDDVVLVKQMYWLPQSKLLERIQEDRVPYDKWVERGLMRVSKGSKVDYHDITSWYIEQVQEHGVRPLWIGYDSWNANYWHDEMVESGFQMVEVRQGAKTMSQPMKQLEADLADKKINYNNNPILKWCMTNTAVKADENGNIRPIKGTAQRARIDGLVSLIDAYVVLQNNLQNFKNMM